MRKRIISILMVVCLLLSVMPMTALAAKVTFDLDGGKTTTDGAEKIEFDSGNDVYVTLPDTETFSKDGYTFKGWSYSNGVSDHEEGVVYVVEPDVTITAVWEETTGGEDPSESPSPAPIIPSVGGGGSSTTTTTTTTTSDGTTTTTVTNNVTGTVTETTTAADGTVSEVVTAKDGTVTAEVEVSANAVAEAVAAGEAYALPMDAVTVGTDIANAPTVTVGLPAGVANAVVEIPVENMTSGTVAVIVDAEGNETVVKISAVGENGLVLNVTDGMTIKLVDRSVDYTDDDHWAKDAIDFATARGLLIGTGDNAFSPDASMTNAMVYTLFARVAGQDTTPAEGQDWREPGAAFAQIAGISTGKPLNDATNREDLAGMIYALALTAVPELAEAEIEAPVFADSDSVSADKAAAMNFCAANGIFVGDDNGLLNPTATATRGEIATLMVRVIETFMMNGII